MSFGLRPWRHPRVAIGAILLLIALLVAATSAQVAGKGPARHFEYVHQEVQAAALTQTLNDLDGQGWEIFQVVPSWAIKNENNDTVLTPRAYEVFGRRAMAAK
jgi:hypothetical protein